MARNPSFVERAIGIESAERSAEPLADDQASENATAKGSRQKTKAKSRGAAKQPRHKHTFAVDDDVFLRLQLTAIDRAADMSDLVNNALRAYLPKTIRLAKDDDQTVPERAEAG